MLDMTFTEKVRSNSGANVPAGKEEVLLPLFPSSHHMHALHWVWYPSDPLLV